MDPQELAFYRWSSPTRITTSRPVRLSFGIHEHPVSNRIVHLAWQGNFSCCSTIFTRYIQLQVSYYNRLVMADKKNNLVQVPVKEEPGTGMESCHGHA
jgi:hypothetical protein